MSSSWPAISITHHARSDHATTLARQQFTEQSCAKNHRAINPGTSAASMQSRKLIGCDFEHRGSEKSFGVPRTSFEIYYARERRS